MTQELFATVDLLNNQGYAAAKAERDYKIALRERTLELKQCNYPVTIIQEVTRGDIEVADLRFNRDVERERLKILYEKINALKLQIRVIQEDIKLEWSRANDDSQT